MLFRSAVIFLPALWLFAAFVSEGWAAALGAVWLAAYVWYFVAYQEDAAKRGRPYGLAMLVFGILVLGAAWGVVREFF